MRLAVAEAIRKVRARVQWKPGKDIAHLQKRQAMGHLPRHATLSEYDAVIQAVIASPEARVFAYRVGETLYVAVRGDVGGLAWLAIFSRDGIIETAFPPGDIEAHLGQAGFTEIGTIAEVLA